MVGPISRLIFTFALLSAATLSPSECLDTEEEPPFPALFLASDSAMSEIFIQSESDAGHSGPQQTKEFVDFDLGKSATSETNELVHRIVYSEAATNITYRYTPGHCDVALSGEVPDVKGLWKAKVELESENGRDSLYFFGVAAVWFNAQMLRKSYAKLPIGRTENTLWDEPAHRWTVKDDLNNCLMHLYFSDVDFDRNGLFELKLIEVESLETKKVVRTVSVVKVDRYINMYDREKYLEIPVGFGCFSSIVDKGKAAESFEDVSSAFRHLFKTSSFRFSFEATATEFPDYSNVEKPRSATMQVEYASHKEEDHSESRYLDLFKIQNSHEDIKRIYHNKFKVLYDVGVSSGKCVVVSSSEAETDLFNVQFQNGLTFFNFISFIDMILNPIEQYYYIKKTNSGKYIFESSKVFSQTDVLRVVQVYSDQVYAREPVLDEIVVIKVNPQKKSITETFRFNLVETELLKSASELAEVFDISEECYINNDRMKYNRDYAWFRVSYPLPVTTIQRLIPRRNALRSHIYNQLLEKEHLGVFRVPKLELIFEKTELVLRALLIDTPKLMLKIVQAFSKLTRKNSVELPEIATDLEHCEDLCRINLCRTLSYCEDSHLCVMTQESILDNKSFEFTRDGSCNIFQPTLSLEKSLKLQEFSLHKVLSRLQHDDYQALVVPAAPEELSDPSSELTETDRRALLDDYLKSLEDFFQKNVDTIPLMSFTADVDDDFLILLPSSFVLEQDPLQELKLIPNDQEASRDFHDRPPVFHKGLVLHKFLKKLVRPDQPDNRLFNGLSYDQCALACVDLKCSSFSYCAQPQECLVTNIYNLTGVEEYVQRDSDCLIAQRDFLTKFDKFPEVQPSNFYLEATGATNSAECAHHCMTQSTFKCLSFDYCGGEKSRCFYFDNRQIVGEALRGADKRNGSMEACEHYSRSYLADFVRLEFRQIKESEMNQLKSMTTTGISVDRCADLCLNEMSDCSAFQFCINLEASKLSQPFQSCQIIESKPTAASPEELFQTSDNCHIFSLAKDSAGVQVQDLALAGFMPSTGGDEGQGDGSTGGLTLGAACLLYLSVAAISGLLVCAVMVARDRNEALNRQLERVEILLHTGWLDRCRRPTTNGA